MLKFQSLPSVRQVFYMLTSTFKHKRMFKQQLISKSKQIQQRNLQQQQQQQIITKIQFEGFKDPSCLARWGPASDSDFGGNSVAWAAYNQYLGQLHFGGKIDIQDINKLEVMPYIGLIQKMPFNFKINAFNTIRVQLIGDGEPIQCQLQIFAKFNYGNLLAFGHIMTQKSQVDKPITYQLPIVNFIPQDVDQPTEITRGLKFDMKRVLSTQYDSPGQCQITKISFRMVSNKYVQRNVIFKKIELVSTVRGLLQNFRDYQKPYFYIVDENQTKDNLMLDKLKVGKYQYFRKRQK